MKIKDVMKKLPETINMDSTLKEARNKMKSSGCHHLPVVDKGVLVGIISDRDIRLMDFVDDGLSRVVEELMTEKPFVVDPESDIQVAVKEMISEQINSVIVQSKDGSILGIFTSTDALKLLQVT